MSEGRDRGICRNSERGKLHKSASRRLLNEFNNGRDL